jgi:hypothetical protein
VGKSEASEELIQQTKLQEFFDIFVNSLMCLLFQVDLYYELSWLPDFDNVFDIESYV